MLRGLFGILLLGATALVGGLIGYQAGAASSAAAAGATVVVTGGFPGLGFLFLLLFIGFLFFAFAGMRRRGPWGPGAMAHGGWGPGGRGPWGGPGGPGGPGASGGPGDAADPRRRWVAEMHRQLHAEDAAGSTPSPAQASPAGESPAS